MSIINLNESFHRETYVSFFQEELLPDDFSPKEEEIDLLFNPQYFKKVTFLGDSRSLGLKVYHIIQNSPHDPRVSLTKETFRLMKEYNDFHVLAFFTSPGSKNYRLSYVTIGITPDDRKVKYEYSNPRRYSYFLGPDAKVHTPARFLIKKGRIVDINDLQERFSVEIVNKEFYKRIATLFTKLVGGKRKEGSKTSDYKAILKLPSITDHKKMQEFAVRMIGRIVFCWFLKKKAAPNGDSLIPEDVLSLSSVNENKNYYHTVLEKLFFQVLNTPIKHRREEFNTEPFTHIPFLNGGLFEPHQDDFYQIDEPFGNSKSHNLLIVPDSWLEELFELLEEYNFTIDENTSMDVELSVDPEMLGRIFENLLAEINPETGETARKSTGSYYTPRPIVEYMVDESLKQYLLTRTGIKEEKLEELLSYSEDVKDLTDEEKEKIIDALDEVKIIDPACGSGAFPMGILQKMVLILQKADPESMNWLIKQLDRIPDSYVRNIVEEQLMKEDWNYIRKLGLIQNSIYGVDIQQIAVEISKLRVFLSLIVDSKIDDTDKNRGIEPLPNLEFKFVCANTLIGLPRVSEKAGGMFEAHAEIKKLKSLRESYFRSFGKEKHRKEKQFREIQDKMFKHSLQMASMGEKTLTLSKWDPFSDKAADWFDPDWMFGIKEGFDIVISNPPYVQLSKLENFQIELKEYFLKEYKSSMGRFNTFGFFTKNGIDLLNDNGILNYIIPNTILTQEYYQKLRLMILESCMIKEIITFDDLAFDDAIVESVVLILQKKRSFSDIKKNEIKIKIFTDNDFNYSHTLFQEIFLKTYKNSFNINLTIELIEFQIKFQDSCILMTDIVNINQAIALKYDRSKYLFKEKKDNEYKPVLDGRNINRYNIQWDGIYLKYDLKAIHSCKREDIFLSKEKLFFRRVGDRLIAAYDDKHFYALNTLIVINSKPQIQYEIKYILSLFNSKLFSYYYKIFLKSTKSIFSEIQARQIAMLPIKKISLNKQKPFVELVDKIILAKENNPNAETSDLEAEIDQMVYQLYGLTPEEIAIVEGELKK